MFLKKSTKHTHVYQAAEADITLHGGPVVKSVYTEQEVIGVIPPKSLLLTVEWES